MMCPCKTRLRPQSIVDALRAKVNPTPLKTTIINKVNKVDTLRKSKRLMQKHQEDKKPPRVNFQNPNY